MKLSFGFLMVVLLNACAPDTLRCDRHLTRINATARTAQAIPVARAAPAGNAR